MKRAGLLTAAIVVAVNFFLLATLPPFPRGMRAAVDPDRRQRTVSGAYHVHSTRSDGAADKDAIADAAARAGLQFVILTDHGDGMGPADAPLYLHGVLCVDAVEISTGGGHYVALDMPPAPYPLGGEPSAVVEDVTRLGGFGIVAHPDSPKRELAWTDWDAPFEGIEWLSADSEWRDESRLALSRVFLQYFLRPAPVLASLLDRPVNTLKRWDSLITHRPVVALAGVDAHGGIGRGLEEGGRRRRALGAIPSYEASFRTLTTRVALERPFSGDATADAKALMSAIRRGHVFTVIDALAAPGYIGFGSDQEGRPWVDYAIPDGGELFMVRDGHDSMPLQGGQAGRYVLTRPEMTGVVRFEVRVPYAPGTPPVPWIVSNPLYFEQPKASPVTPAAAEDSAPLGTEAGWHVEKDPSSRATIVSSRDDVKLDYTLGSGERRSQFAAVVTDLQGRVPTFRAIAFSIAGGRAARVSVQLRFPSSGGARWAKSVYVDPARTEARVPVSQMVPADFQAGAAPDPSTAGSLLFVVDLTNARPGDSNSIEIRDVRFVR